MNKLYILLATYNGNKYIAEQLDSLLCQTYTDFHILISDDGSNDSTVSIINHYCETYKKIKLLPPKNKKMGVCGNFEYLLENADDADYIMFCDQDDIWQPDKVLLAMASMKKEETLHTNQTPILVYSNMQYVSSDLTSISYLSICVEQKNKPTLLVQNYIYGCTMLLNKCLYLLLLPISKNADNHDAWTSLVACMTGKIVYIPDKTILYRQHDSNASGNVKNSSFKKRFQRNILNIKTERGFLHKRLNMLKDACEFLKNKPHNQYYLLACEFLQKLSLSKYSAINFMLKNKILMLTKLQTLKLFFLILTDSFGKK